MNRFARGAGRRKAKNALGAALILVALCALGGMALAGFLLRPPPTDPDTLCRTDISLGAHTFILVDATDRLEPRHRRRLRAIVAQERARLAPYDRLSIASLRAEAPQAPRILFSLCDPGDGRDANPLYQNTRRAQERWRAAFGDVLDRAVRRAGGGRAANASPIVAGVRAAAADPDFGAEIPKRRLVLVSDLLEHGPGFSLYAEGADYPRYRGADPRAPPDLDGVAVRVAMLDRPEQTARQTAALELFWRPFLDAAGAQSTSVDPTP